MSLLASTFLMCWSSVKSWSFLSRYPAFVLPVPPLTDINRCRRSCLCPLSGLLFPYPALIRPYINFQDIWDTTLLGHLLVITPEELRPLRNININLSELHSLLLETGCSSWPGEWPGVLSDRPTPRVGIIFTRSDKRTVIIESFSRWRIIVEDVLNPIEFYFPN